MFSQASVILFGGGYAWQGVCVAGGHSGWRAYMAGGCMVGGMRAGEMATAAEDMATAADCTHPTGMHSCFDLSF